MDDLWRLLILLAVPIVAALLQRRAVRRGEAPPPSGTD
jgi:hypothetical protein